MLKIIINNYFNKNYKKVFTNRTNTYTLKLSTCFNHCL